MPVYIAPDQMRDFASEMELLANESGIQRPFVECAKFGDMISAKRKGSGIILTRTYKSEAPDVSTSIAARMATEVATAFRMVASATEEITK